MFYVKYQNPNYYLKSLWSFVIEGYCLIVPIATMLSFEYFVCLASICIVSFDPLKNPLDCRYYFLLMLQKKQRLKNLLCFWLQVSKQEIEIGLID